MRPRLLRHALFLGAALALCALLPAPGRADIQNPGRSSFPGDRNTERNERPAGAVPQTVSVVEGGSVTVVLRARGHAGEMIDFLLRTPPAHGTLEGEAHQLTLNTASVVYTHRPGDNATEDSFTYAVQTRGGPVSAEGTVVVRIQEPPPVLTVTPAELDFGAVKAGSSTRAQVTLSNAGGGEAAGRLDPPSPWSVEGPATYRLARGASQTFALVFEPQAERAYAESLHFRYETGGGVRLVGTGLAGPGRTPRPANALAGPSLPPGAPGGTNGANAEGAASAPGAAGSRRGGPGTAAPPSASPAATAGVTSLEPANRGGSSSMPTVAATAYADPDEIGVPSFTVLGRGRTTLDLSWRALVPTPRSYRVELRYLSLDEADKLLVDWRPYAQVEFRAAHGFVTARLSGLEPDSQQCVRIVAVDASGRLAAPSPLRVIYTLPSSTWWRPTPLGVLGLLLLLCGGMVWRQRWETRQILRELDESRRPVLR